VGFWGSFVVCRAATPLFELNTVAERSEGIDWHQECPGGWQVGQYQGPELAEDSQPLLIELAVETGAPTLTGFVLDSDAVAVEGYSPGHGHWLACLAREAMRSYSEQDGEDFDAVFPSAEAATAAATRWAADAGLRPDPREVQRVFCVDRADPLAEELFLSLLAGLGVGSPTSGAPTAPPEP
jgi:hypothetical protein